MAMTFFIIELIIKSLIAFMKRKVKQSLLLWQEQEKTFIVN